MSPQMADLLPARASPSTSACASSASKPAAPPHRVQRAWPHPRKLLFLRRPPPDVAYRDLLTPYHALLPLLALASASPWPPVLRPRMRPARLATAPTRLPPATRRSSAMSSPAPLTASFARSSPAHGRATHALTSQLQHARSSHPRPVASNASPRTRSSSSCSRAASGLRPMVPRARPRPACAPAAPSFGSGQMLPRVSLGM